MHPNLCIAGGLSFAVLAFRYAVRDALAICSRYGNFKGKYDSYLTFPKKLPRRNMDL